MWSSFGTRLRLLGLGRIKKKPNWLTQTVCDDSIEEFNESEAKIEQQEQEEISWIRIGKDESLPVVEFAFDSKAKASFVLVG